MKTIIKITVFALVFMFIHSCEEEPNVISDDVNDVSNFVLSSGGTLGLDDPCGYTGSLINPNPFTQELYVVGGYSFGNSTCWLSNVVSSCFAVQLRHKLRTEFGNYTNNVACGVKGVACPQNAILVDTVEEYNRSVEELFDVETTANATYQIADENYIYQEFLCRLLDQFDTNATEYLVIDYMFTDELLCGCNDSYISYKIKIYRVI